MNATPYQLEAVNEKTSSDRLIELAKVSTELGRLVAKNPSTPPELLRELANSNDATTHQNVAANPNTPTEVLLNLGAKFPEQLLDNPIFSLLLLENFNLVNKMPISPLISILNLEKAPVFFLEQAVNIEGYLVRREVAQKPNLPLKLLEQLIRDKDAFVRREAAYCFSLLPPHVAPQT